MPYHFHTNKLNKRLYKSMTRNVLLNLHQNVSTFELLWDVYFWDLDQTNPQFFEHIKTTSGQKINTNMASGVCGLYRIDLYLHDSDNELITRQNSDRVQHELCHAALIGTNDFVSGVHDNIDNRFTIKFWYWNKWRWSSMQLSVIDIRDFVTKLI